MPARLLGKWKANVQFLAVAAALFPPIAGTAWVADAALWVAVVMTVMSGIDLIANVHAGRRARSRHRRQTRRRRRAP